MTLELLSRRGLGAVLRDAGAGGYTQAELDAAVAAATLAGYADGEADGLVTGNAEGRAARALAPRNPGLFGSPTTFDPSGIGVWSAPDANGTYTIDIVSAVARNNPAVGTSRIWALPAMNGAAVTEAMLIGLIRAYATGQASSGVDRWWCVAMDTADPTTARGWGAIGSVEAGSTDHLAGVTYTTSAGVWGVTFATTSTGQGWMEAVNASGRSNVPNLIGYRRTLANVLPGGASSQLATPTPTVATPDFSGGNVYVCLGYGCTAALTATRTLRGQSALVDLDAADAVGVGLTP